MRHWHIVLPFVVAQFGFDFGGDAGFLDTVLGFFEQLFAQIFALLFNLIVAVGNYLLAVDEFIYGFSVTLFKDVKGAFSWLWEQISKITLLKLFKGLRDALAALKRWVDKIVGWLEQLRKWYDKYFNQFVKPVLIAIQRLRKILQLFRLLGFKWAARLDARLATIENRIVQAYELIRTNLNQVISWAQLIADPFALLRRNPVLGSLLRTAPEVKNAIDRATNHVTTQPEVDKMNRDGAWYTASGRAEMTAYSKGGAAPAFIVDARANFTAAVAELPSLANQALPGDGDGLGV
jgi:hypothetical protein